jgi:hypothetical protein
LSYLVILSQLHRLYSVELYDVCEKDVHGGGRDLF